MKSAENSAETPKSKGKARGRPFPSGTSGNPGGRPPSLASLIQKLTRSGEDLVEFWNRIFRGEEIIKIGGQEFQPTLKERMEAAKQLADRGFGLPAQRMEHSGPDGDKLVIEIRKLA